MNKKKGIILIILAVLIFSVYLIFYFIDFKSNENITVTPTESAVINTASATLPPNGTEETMSDEIKININSEILNLMKIDEKTLQEEIRIYANSSGYAAAESVNDMDEVNINYALKTITVPCFFKVGKHKGYFDLIYSYQNKQWRYVPFNH